jgi:hypothetical protein
MKTDYNEDNVYLDGRGVNIGFIDRDGNMVKRNPIDYPYSFDAYVTWVCDGFREMKMNGNVYSDRLYQWDISKFNELCMKYWGDQSQYFDNRNPSEVEAFLRDYLGKPELKLIMIEKLCNVSSGYPLWLFSFFS